MTLASNAALRHFLIAIAFIGCFFSKTALSQTADLALTDTLSIIKPQSQTEQNFSGDRQYDVVRNRLVRPLRVRVIKQDGEPVENIPVYFELISHPQKAKSFALEDPVAYTDDTGFAETYFTLGSAPGEYQITARINAGQRGSDLIVFNTFARKANWILMLIIGLAGGLGMFLYGMKLMSDGMKKSAGDRLRSILSRLTHNRFIALAVGAFVTMVIQSSSATTVMLISFVQAQLMSFTQSLGIILGANIGTTFTAQIIAFKLTDYALLMVAAGIALMFLGKKEKTATLGETLLGFGLLFYGMQIMSTAMYPLRTYDPFIELLIKLENPIWGLLVGTIFTALIQSSSAFTGILIVLAIQGLLTLEAGIPLIFGANIGTCVTAGLASLNASREAKRVAIAHTAFQIAGVILFILWIPSFVELIRWISPKGSADLSGTAHLAAVVPRQIANAHTIFNIATALIVLPFLKLTADIILRILPEQAVVESEPYQARFLDLSLLSTPALALSMARAEVLRMGDMSRTMVKKIIDPFMERDREALDEIEMIEEEVNYLESKINDYLTRISQQSIPEDQVGEVFQMMYTVTEFEQIADIVAKQLWPRALEWLGGNHQFSEQGKAEILSYHVSSLKQISRAIDTFQNADLKKAKRMKVKFKKYRSMGDDYMRTHYERLREAVPETQASTEYHIDLLEQFRRINGHSTNIARILIEWSGEVKDINSKDSKKKSK